jgi:predicted GNAT family acetyltransferase
MTSLINMDIQQDNSEKGGSFYIDQNGERLAEMTYVWAGPSQLIINHTEVSDKLRGMGAGKQLVTAAVNYAREKGIKIIPLCPFAKSVFDKITDFADVRV